MTTVAIVYHSGYGHTAVVADQVAQGVTEAGATPKLLRITGVDQNFDEFLADITAADAVIFGAPTYMGGPSAPFKVFADATSKPWFTQAWKDKIAAGFTNSLSLSGDKLSTLSYFSVLAAQQGMVWVGTGLPPGASTGDVSVEGINRVGSSLGLMTQSDNVAADVSPSGGDLKTARLFGARIAQAAARWNRGA
jgi:NAD(P)H dehydrogenase (quinone)